MTLRFPWPTPYSLGAAVLLSSSCLVSCWAASVPGATDPPEAPRGLYFQFDAERLETEGYPDRQHEEFFWDDRQQNWGVLYDDQNIAYGPNAYYQRGDRTDHPYFTVTDSTMEDRWFRMTLGNDLNEDWFGHFLELLDLALYELRPVIHYDPPQKLDVLCTSDLDEYKRITGMGYWIGGVAKGPHLVFQPTKIMFKRTLCAHFARNVVAKSLLDLKCHGLVPPWLREGLASYLAEEGNELLNYKRYYAPVDSLEGVWPPEQVMRRVYPQIDVVQGRIALYNSFMMVWRLVESRGLDALQHLLDEMEQGITFEESVHDIYGLDLSTLLEDLDPTKNGEPITQPKFSFQE